MNYANVRHREAPAPRRRARRPRDPGARRDGRRRDVAAQARDPALRRGARGRQPGRARLLGLGRVRRRGPRACDLHRRGRALVLPPPRRGRGPGPLLRERAGGGARARAARARRALPAADPGRALSARLSRLRRGGPRARPRRGDRAGRALDPVSARGLGDRRAGGPVARPGAPPRWVLLVAVLSIVAAEVGGGSMARYKVELTRWAREGMLARPGVHGLVGVRDVDERILDEALVKFDA